MPNKDLEAKKAYHREYNKNMTDEQKERKRATTKAWWSSDFGKFFSHRRHARRRGIEFLLTFEEWLDIWKSSGHFEERNPTTGYVMCRKGDEGAYSKDNVYIASASQNKRDAWFNNKIKLPNTKQTYKDLNEKTHNNT